MNLDLIRTRIKLHEGFSSTVYRCSENVSTIGWGHMLTEDDDFVEGVEYDKAELEELFEKDFAVAVNDADKIINEHELILPDIAYEVLVEMCFQLGRPRVSKFKKMIAALKEHKFQEAADEMIDSKWHKQTPERCSKLASLMRLNNDNWKKKK